MNSDCKLLRRYVAKRLYIWKENADSSKTTAELARLRRSIGKKPGEIPEIWDLLFEEFPEELMSRDGNEPTRAEWAAATVLAMYAMHQQGKNIKTESMNEKGNSLGKAIRKLIAEESNNEESVRKRFNVFATSDDMIECSHHLRSLIQLLRSKNVPLDYVELAEDLYWFQTYEGANKVRLKWGQDFYRITNTNNIEDKGAEKENEE